MGTTTAPKYEWIGDMDSKVEAEDGHYTMMVEDVGRDVWWCVRFKGEVIASSDITGDPSPNMRGGRFKCMRAVKRHKLSFI